MERPQQSAPPPHEGGGRPQGALSRPLGIARAHCSGTADSIKGGSGVPAEGPTFARPLCSRSSQRRRPKRGEPPAPEGAQRPINHPALGRTGADLTPGPSAPGSAAFFAVPVLLVLRWALAPFVRRFRQSAPLLLICSQWGRAKCRPRSPQKYARPPDLRPGGLGSTK